MTETNEEGRMHVWVSVDITAKLGEILYHRILTSFSPDRCCNALASMIKSNGLRTMVDNEEDSVCQL
jgi:hypothetical protein